MAKLTVTKTKKTADMWFSRYIRLRDADDNGWCRCISCQKPYRWDNIHNGHYIKREKMATRYHEKNCNAQCLKCNKYKNGNEAQYAYHLNLKYGAGTSDLLVILSAPKVHYKC